MAFDREPQRGILLSPEKGGRNGPKFLRNGLAERASQMLSRSHTVLSLWQLETETLVRSFRRLTPDLRLRIVQVLCIPSCTDRFSQPSTRRFGLALCEVLNNEKPGMGSRQRTSAMILLSDSLPSSELGVRSAAGLEKDRDILVWRPWHEVEMPFDLEVPFAIPFGDEPGNSAQQGGWYERGMATLLCSRFLIV